MKKVFLKAAATMMVVCILCSTSMLSSFAATGSTRTDGNIVYYTENGKDTGIKSIKNKGTLFYDCSDNKESDITTQFLIDYLTTEKPYQDANGNTGSVSPLYEWANIASAIFENGGKYTCTDNYNQYYSPTYSTSSTENVNVAEKLANNSCVTEGSRKSDNYQSTGLNVASSFSDLRYRMCKHISDRIYRNALDPEDVLSQGDYNPDALPKLSNSDSRKIIYNMVTSISRDGGTCKYKYNSYAVGFYDFDLKILDVEGIDYVGDETQTKKNSSVKEKILNTTENNTLFDVNTQTTTEMSKSETISTSISNSQGFSFSEMFGGSVEITSGAVKGIIQSSITAGQAFESAQTNETTTVSSVSQSKSVDYKVPPHTVVNVEQTIAKDSMTTKYDTPVALTYKVVIFSMSGDVYADSAWTLCQSTAGYSQSNFCTFFGGDSEEEGYYAYDSLAKKVKNADDELWDKVYGNNHIFYKYHDGHSDPTDTGEYKLNWNGVNNTYKTNTGKSEGIEKFASFCPMLSTGATTTTTVESMNSVVCAPQPMYLPSTFRVVDCTDPRYYIFEGGTFNLGTISIGAFDRFGAPYYDFLMKDGYWSVKEGSEDVISYDPASYTVSAKGIGTGTLVWQLKDTTEYTALKDNATVTKDNANTVEVKFTVREYPFK